MRLRSLPAGAGGKLIWWQLIWWHWQSIGGSGGARMVRWPRQWPYGSVGRGSPGGSWEAAEALRHAEGDGGGGATHGGGDHGWWLMAREGGPSSEGEADAFSHGMSDGVAGCVHNGSTVVCTTGMPTTKSKLKQFFF
ncbi:hypothetical protein ACP70R_003266 [Stipagrostis hirtigluma subsp. patula]